MKGGEKRGGRAGRREGEEGKEKGVGDRFVFDVGQVVYMASQRTGGVRMALKVVVSHE